MNWTRLVFALALPPQLSACMGTCCHDGAPPEWTSSVDLGEGIDFSCEATMSRGSNVIEFNFTIEDCTKLGGDPSIDAGDRACSVGYQDVDGPRDYVVAFSLNARDETYLGGLDFDLAVVCQNLDYRSHETFSTQSCEG